MVAKLAQELFGDVIGELIVAFKLPQEDAVCNNKADVDGVWHLTILDTKEYLKCNCQGGMVSALPS